MVSPHSATTTFPSVCLVTAAVLFGIASVSLAPPAHALEVGDLRINSRNGWRAFEVISIGDNPPDDSFSWAMPGTFDGLGAWLPDASTLRLQINHEITDAAISEVNLDLTDFRTAISNMISGGSTGGTAFVRSARQAYDRWSGDGGMTWTGTSNTSNTAFYRFCSGQSYSADTFGLGRGFADNIYISGEEGNTNRLFALDLDYRELYQLSGVTGSAADGIGGMPFDSWENAALLDTGETGHVALLLSPDGGSQRRAAMRMYIGQKGKDASGHASTDFLARNGLAYGSYYYLNDALPHGGTSLDGTFDTTALGALTSTKLEDIDTSPSNPTRAVLGDQDSGVFTFDFLLDFSSGNFSSVGSSFSVTKIQNHIGDTDGAFGDADNVDWTDATILDGVAYDDGLIFVNEDSGTAGGEIWMSEPDGSGLTRIGDTIGIRGSTETSGILDISRLVGYRPASILLTSNQGSNASLSVLINPHANVLSPGDFGGDNDFTCADIDALFTAIDIGNNQSEFDMNGDGMVDDRDIRHWQYEAGMANDFLEAIRLGDADLNGQVNAKDLNQLALNWRSTTATGWCQGDFNRDGNVNAEDLNSLALNWQSDIRGFVPSPGAVPEPNALAMLLVVLLLSQHSFRLRSAK